MGFLRKKVKQIGKAIKKVVKKVGRAFGKLGIVGQIGLMMFLPTLGGSLWGSLGNFATSGTGFLNRAAGAIFNAGNAIGTAYSTVTKAISNGVNRAANFMKGDGFILSPDKTSIFTSTDKAVDLTKKVSDKLSGTAINAGETVVTAEPVKKNLLDKGKDYIAEGIEGAKEALSDPKTLVKESVESGVKSGLATRLSYDVAGDPPEQRVITTNFDVGSINSYASTGTFNTEDFTRGNQAYQALGSSWGAGSSIAAPFLTQEVFSGGDINYAKRVQQLRYT